MTYNERLNHLFKQHNLGKEDYFKSPQGWAIITRAGIDKIQASTDIKIKYELISFVPDESAAVKAIATLGDKVIETYGEATPKTTRQAYKLAMAEKRAMSRAVLKLTGFYELGIYGQDEADEFSDGLRKRTL